jgi:hypothetical protein
VAPAAGAIGVTATGCASIVSSEVAQLGRVP